MKASETIKNVQKAFADWKKLVDETEAAIKNSGLSISEKKKLKNRFDREIEKIFQQSWLGEYVRVPATPARKPLSVPSNACLAESFLLKQMATSFDRAGDRVRALECRKRAAAFEARSKKI